MGSATSNQVNGTIWYDGAAEMILCEPHTEKVIKFLFIAVRLKIEYFYVLKIFILKFKKYFFYFKLIFLCFQLILICNIKNN